MLDTKIKRNNEEESEDEHEKEAKKEENRNKKIRQNKNIKKNKREDKDKDKDKDKEKEEEEGEEEEEEDEDEDEEGEKKSSDKKERKHISDTKPKNVLQKNKAPLKRQSIKSITPTIISLPSKTNEETKTNSPLTFKQQMINALKKTPNKEDNKEFKTNINKVNIKQYEREREIYKTPHRTIKKEESENMIVYNLQNKISEIYPSQVRLKDSN